jgi:hypothetical protein
MERSTTPNCRGTTRGQSHMEPKPETRHTLAHQAQTASKLPSERLQTSQTTPAPSMPGPFPNTKRQPKQLTAFCEGPPQWQVLPICPPPLPRPLCALRLGQQRATQQRSAVSSSANLRAPHADSRRQSASHRRRGRTVAHFSSRQHPIATVALRARSKPDSQGAMWAPRPGPSVSWDWPRSLHSPNWPPTSLGIQQSAPKPDRARLSRTVTAGEGPTPRAPDRQKS